MECPTLASVIDEVTVYREGARIRRLATLKRANGCFPEHLLLDGLPACLQDDSVRVKFEPLTAGETVPIAGDLKIRLLVTMREDKGGPDRERADRLAELYEQQNLLSEKVAAVSNSIERLQSGTVPARPQPMNATEPMPDPTPAVVTLTSFVQEQRLLLQAEKHRLEAEQEDLGEQIQHLEYTIAQENEEPQVSAQQLQKGVAIRLRETEAAAGEARVVLEYMVPGAQWSPNYSLQIDGKQEEAELDVRALVAQATGEDWRGVKLRLSTALPQQWTELPELQSLRIGRRQASPPKRGWRPPPTGAETLFADYEAFKAEAGLGLKLDLPETEPDELMTGAAMDLDDLLEQTRYGEELEKEERLSAKSLLASRAPDAMPPPGAMPPPAPCLAAPSAAPSIGSLLASPFQAAAGMVADAAESMSKKRSAPKRKAMRGAGAGGGGGAMFDAFGEMALPPAEIALGADLLNYPSLRMAGRDSSSRGKLQPALSAQYEGAPSTAISALCEAVSLAQSLPGLPERHSLPYSPDGFDYAYVCATPVDIPSRGKYVSIPVSRQTVTIKIKYVAVPREATEVFRVAKVTNPLANPLLPGPVDLYLNGDFFITSSLGLVAPQGHIDLGLGVEEAVKVARNTTFAEETGGALGGKLFLKHAIKIEVINNLAREIDLEVRERVPITRDEEDEIEVTIHDVAPAWQDFQEPPLQRRGRYRWQVRVAGGGKANLHAAYDLRISSKNEIVGGNRREA